jgi:hypothetical protein
MSWYAAEGRGSSVFRLQGIFAAITGPTRTPSGVGIPIVSQKLLDIVQNHHDDRNRDCCVLETAWTSPQMMRLTWPGYKMQVRHREHTNGSVTRDSFAGTFRGLRGDV